MKKLMAVSLSLAMLLMMTACGSPSQNDTPSSGEGDISSSDNLPIPGDGETDDTLDGNGEDNSGNEEDASPDGSETPKEDGSTSKPETKPDPTSKPETQKPSNPTSKPETSKPNTPTTKPETQKPSNPAPETPSTPAKTYDGTLPELVSAIYDKQPVEFALADPIAVDLSDSYSGQYFLGLTDTSKIAEAYYSEPMIGSQAYSLVVVRVKDAADAADVAKKMYNGIDQAKWICVNADAVAAGVYGDTIMLVMVSSGLAETLHTDLRAAFASVCGGTLDQSMDRVDSPDAPEDGLAAAE